MKIIYPIGAYAPGNYMGICANCQTTFTGDKLSKQCEPCAINSIVSSHDHAISKLHKLTTALQSIKLNNDIIENLLKTI